MYLNVMLKSERNPFYYTMKAPLFQRFWRIFAGETGKYAELRAVCAFLWEKYDIFLTSFFIFWRNPMDFSKGL